MRMASSVADVLADDVALCVDHFVRAVRMQVVHDVTHAIVNQKVRILRRRVHEVNVPILAQLGELGVGLVISDDKSHAHDALDVFDDPRDEFWRRLDRLLEEFVSGLRIVCSERLSCLFQGDITTIASLCVRRRFERPSSTIQHDYDFEVRVQQLL